MNHSVKLRLLIFNDQFFPAYKAGGPIQSLTNLAISLEELYTISVITGSRDLNEVETLKDIQINSWNDVSLPNASSSIKVWYAATGEPGIQRIHQLVKETDPAFIYLNGMFSYRTVILPLISCRQKKLVICPRGMLQLGALAGKSFKKKIYLAILKSSGLLKNITWHATNEAEKNDIIREFGNRSKIVVAENIPRKPVETIEEKVKHKGELRLVYLSLISEKKNLLQLINIIGSLTDNINLDIYGPVKDLAYWKKCQDAIKRYSNKVYYKGDVMPNRVHEIFNDYHASVLLTKGENFGHALYESLSAGRPVITSYFTPWNDLEAKKAGWNIDISNEAGIKALVNRIAGMDQLGINEYYQSSHQCAIEYYNNHVNIDPYKELFSI